MSVNKTYWKMKNADAAAKGIHGDLLTMRGRSAKATAQGYHNSPLRARRALLEALNRDAIRAMGKDKEIPGRGSMNKDQLIDAILDSAEEG